MSYIKNKRVPSHHPSSPGCRLEALESRQLFSTGALDPNFAVGGKLTTTLNAANDTPAIDVVSDNNGKLIVAAPDGGQVAILRYRPNGTLDPNFAAAGKAIVSTEYSPLSIMVQSTGKILVGSVIDSLGSEFESFSLVRFNANGTLDSTYPAASSSAVAAGINHSQLQSFSSIISFIAATTLQSDNKIILVNTDEGVNSSDNIIPLNDFAVMRLGPNGTVDSTFNGGKEVQTTFGAGSTAEPNSVVVQPNGRIVVVGQVNGQFEAVRYQSNGALDTNFGTGGKMPITFAGGSNALGVAVQSSGRIVVAGAAGSSNQVVAVTRILGDHTILTNGQSMVTTGASLAADPRLAGSTIASQTLNFSFGTGASAVHGQVKESVIKETTGGTLDFYYQIIAATGSLGGIASLLASNFAGFTTYVDYRPDSSGTLAPVTASRSSDGKALTFNFLAAPSGNGLVTAGKSSYSLFVKTNAVHFSAAGKVLLNNIASLAGYQPTV